MTTADRCPICDREECDRAAAYSAQHAATDCLPDEQLSEEEWRELNARIFAAETACAAHRADWRARALAAEAVASTTLQGFRNACDLLDQTAETLNLEARVASRAGTAMRLQSRAAEIRIFLKGAEVYRAE